MLTQYHTLYLNTLRAVTAARLTPEERERQALAPASALTRTWATARAAGVRATVADWLGWHARREMYQAAYREFFRAWDVLRAPITLRTAFPHIPMTWPPSDADLDLTIEIDGQQFPYEHQLVYPGAGDAMRPTGDRVPRRALARWPANRAPVDWTVPGRPDAHPCRWARSARDGRPGTPAGLRYDVAAYSSAKALSTASSVRSTSASVCCVEI
jgi:hypothetical protein